MIPVGVVLFCAPVSADPTPGPPGSDNSVLGTLEAVVQAEGLLSSDSMGTWIVYGGPAVVRICSPEELEGFGLGAELGAEVRRSLAGPFSGPFMGVYAGLGILWTGGEKENEAATAGAKTGWRIPLTGNALLEPYLGVGLEVYSFSDEDQTFDSIVYLGMKLGFGT
jgi:hypothetical protein